MPNVPLTVGGQPAALGSFSKGIKGSVSLNYGRSATDNCDKGCSHFDDCYAARLERYRSSVMQAGERRFKTDPADLTDQALKELGKRPDVSWLRFSAFGALPKLGSLSERKRDRFIKSMQSVIDCMRDRGGLVHLPAETARKANSYRRRLFGVTVRESCQSVRRWLVAPGAVSVCRKPEKPGRANSVALAHELARRRRKATGRAVIVCPAVLCSFKRIKTDKAKCGACKACALPNVDVVYPHH
jgi:hypothetical protein